MTLIDTAELRRRMATNDRNPILAGETFVLHVWDPPQDDQGNSIWPGHRTPRCFQKTKRWAHLFCEDTEQLEKKARALGVRAIKVSRRGRRGQHIDLCGRPLEKAIRECGGVL